MKIVFLLGSMEIKTNGVAAYTNIISKHLQKLGHSVSIITLFEINSFEEKNTEVYNIKKELSFPKRLNKLKSILLNLNPDLVSIQYVPYSFNRKGIPFELILYSPILAKFRIHIMVHEPWILIKKQITFKNRVISKLQSTILLSLINFTKPILLTSTITFYTQLISSSTRLLPLFSNIKFQLKPNSISNKQGTLNCVFFGSFSMDIEGFRSQLIWIKKYCDKNKLIPKLTLIGANGINKEKNIEIIIAILGFENLFDLGWLNENEISIKLQEQDLGISRATAILYGKSGSTLAMLEHGLPVLLRGLETSDSISSYSNHLIQITDNDDIKLSKFEPKYNESEIHTHHYLNLINESLLFS